VSAWSGATATELQPYSEMLEETATAIDTGVHHEDPATTGGE